MLVVDDDPSVTASIAMLLKQHGYAVLTASNPAEAATMLTQHAITLVLLDMNFSRNTSGDEGMSSLRKIKESHPDLPVILMTAWASIELAVNGMKEGASDFIAKPWSNNQLLRTIETCVDLICPPNHGVVNRAELDAQYRLSNILGEDPKFVEVLATVTRVAKTNASVLILGESGTGKELIAEALHNNSNRSDSKLVRVNLGGISSSLFESEMFGHVKGAFTDAKHDRIGLFEMANRGTIFLDEIGDLDLASQVKLLRVLQDQSFQAVGSSDIRKSDVRVVSATNKVLKDLVADGRFREDLLYRINLITIELPPLRQRKKDIGLLAKAHLKRMEELYGLGRIAIDESGYNWLERQTWPGNIRQLLQTIERAVLMSDTRQLSSQNFQSNQTFSDDSQHNEPSLPVGAYTLNEIEKMMIERSMEAYRHNISKVAEALGISRAALYRRLEKHQLDK